MATGEPLGPALIARLLLQGEGVALDYKRDQYNFPRGSDLEKAKLLKDVLSFANAYRDDDAFILIGVGEGDDDRPQIVGTDAHFDDADLQQYVNASGNLNRHVVVSYNVVDVDGKKLGVIRIPKQQRPVFAKRDIGFDPAEGARPKPVIRSNTVYFRRGSSTLAATPDDVYEMGRLDTAEDRLLPAFDLSFADLETRLPATRHTQTQHRTTSWTFQTFPAYDVDENEASSRSVSLDYRDRLNLNFYRDAAAYLHFEDGFRPLTFAVKNTGDSLATDVRVELTFPGEDEQVMLILNRDVPKVPERKISGLYAPVIPGLIDQLKGHHGPSVRLEARGDKRVVTVIFPKIQAHATEICEEPIHFMAKPPIRTMQIDAMIFADQLATPQRETLTIAVLCDSREYGWSNLKRLIDDRI